MHFPAVLCFGSLCCASDRCARVGSLYSGSLCCARQRWAALAELVPGDALRVPIEAVSALLGPARAALQRVEGLSPQKERQKEWKNRVFGACQRSDRYVERLRALSTLIRPGRMTTAPGRTWATSWRLLADFKGAQPRWARIHWTPPRRSPHLRVWGQSALSWCQPSHWGPGSPPPPTPPLPVYSTTQQPAGALASGR